MLRCNQPSRIPEEWSGEPAAKRHGPAHGALIGERRQELVASHEDQALAHGWREL